MIVFSWPYLEISRRIDASPSAVWEVMTDTSYWPLWGPSVAAVESETSLIRHNSRGRIRTSLGFWAPFHIDRYVEGKSWSWRVYGIPATGHRVQAHSDGSCSLVFQVPVAAAPYLMVCWVALRRIARLLAVRSVKT